MTALRSSFSGFIRSCFSVLVAVALVAFLLFPSVYIGFTADPLIGVLGIIGFGLLLSASNSWLGSPLSVFWCAAALMWTIVRYVATVVMRMFRYAREEGLPTAETGGRSYHRPSHLRLVATS